MALAAAYFECEPGDAERLALAWLEQLDPPQLRLGAEATPTPATPTFVPMNDSRAVGRGGSIQTLPALKRHRAERMFPRTHLPDGQDAIYLDWPDADDAEVNRHQAALSRLCALVARVGHTTSLVRMWIDGRQDRDLKTLLPDPTSNDKLRVVARTIGTLDRLATAFATLPHRASIKSSHGYSEAHATKPAAAKTIFDDRRELFRLESAGSSFRWLQLESTLALTRTLREAIIERCPIQPPPEVITGHAGDRSPSAQPHMAVVPVPYVGSEHADGHLLGVGVAMPRGTSDADLQALFKALEAIADDSDGSGGTGLGFDGVRFPGLGQWRLIRQGIFDDFRVNLNGPTWTASAEGCRTWASVTPLVFDQHAKARSKGAYLDECVELVAQAATRVVVGANVERVRVLAVPPLRGVPPARDFPRLKRKDGSERRHVHVQIDFDQPLVGPLLIGAGRYRGYGLCRPLLEGGRR
jgi:CRISPR-associated protein Csb2